MDNVFVLKNRPKWVLKDMAVYQCFDLSLHLMSFWNSVYIGFQNRGLIFKNSKFSNWHKNLSSPKYSNFFDWILGFMHPMVTCKLKSSDKLWFCHFCPKQLCITGKSIQFTVKAVLMNRQKNLMIFNLTIFPSNMKKKKKKKKTYTHK